MVVKPDYFKRKNLKSDDVTWIVIRPTPVTDCSSTILKLVTSRSPKSRKKQGWFKISFKIDVSY